MTSFIIAIAVAGSHVAHKYLAKSLPECGYYWSMNITHAKQFKSMEDATKIADSIRSEEVRKVNDGCTYPGVLTCSALDISANNPQGIGALSILELKPVATSYSTMIHGFIVKKE